MRVILFGAAGMVGQDVPRECLVDLGVVAEIHDHGRYVSPRNDGNPSNSRKFQSFCHPGALRPILCA